MEQSPAATEAKKAAGMRWAKNPKSVE